MVRDGMVRLADRRLKVLYVEDNEDIRRVFDVLIRLTVGVETEVLLASDGEEGVELALKEKPDAIFMDEELPLMDGLEATRQLRAESGLRDVPVIMISAHLNREERRRRAEEAGVTLLIDKPFEAQDLEDALRRVLGE
jgi:CheY-like chemotaxis protein